LDTGLDWSTVTEPFKDFVNIIFDYLPRVVGALVLFIVFWILATVLRWIVRRALKREPEKYPVANGVGTAVYWIVWLCFIPAVVGILQLTGLLDPIEALFEKVLLALPNIFAAGLVLIVAFFLGRLVARLVTSLLTKAGFNRVLMNIGLTKTEPDPEKLTPSKVVGYAVLVAIMLLAATAAAELLNFTTIRDLVGDLTVFLGQVALGIVVIGLGIFLATLAARAIRATGRPTSNILAMLAQVAIMVFAVAMGLRAMGFANEIVIIGFAAIVGAIAVAFAIAFGVGGREVAGKELNRWVKALRSDNQEEK